MADSPCSADVTQATFAALVIEQSATLPVVVDFWASWCGPCRALKPILEKLAVEFQGRFFLAKIDTDQEQQLATRYDVRSLPTVKVFRDGVPVDEFMGALPEPEVRAVLERHLPRPSDSLLLEGRALLARGDLHAAVARFEAANAADPGRENVVMALTRAYLAANRPDDAAAALKTLPGAVQMGPEVQGLHTVIEFARIAAEAPAIAALEAALATNPKDSAARHQLAARHVQSGNYEPALEQLLQLVKTDRKFGDGAGRKGMVALFSALDSNSDLVRNYRAKLAMALN